MPDPEIKKRITELQQKLVDLLTENLIKDPNLTDVAMEEARRIRQEIESYGWLVTWGGDFDLQTLRFRAYVELWRPRANLSPEDQKIYDEWYARNNGIKPN